MDGSGVDQERPGAGPFRNIKLYDKWNSGILKVMNDYSHVLKGGNTVVRLSDTDGSGKGNLVKPSKSLWQFMLDALEGGKITGLATGNNATQQHAFLVGYFGDGIKKEKTTTDSTETSTKATGATGSTGSTGEEVDKVEYFKETDFIDVSTSNLYRTEVLGSINSSDSGSILPNAPNEVVYMYVSKNGDDKYIYLFEDLNFINNKVGDDVKYNKVPKPESASGVVLVARVDNDVRDGKLSANTNFQYVKGGSDEVVSLSTKGFDINKIEVYSDPSDDEARMTMSMVGEDFVFEKGLTQNTFKNDN
jgi:hypothetical protein